MRGKLTVSQWSYLVLTSTDGSLRKSAVNIDLPNDPFVFTPRGGESNVASAPRDRGFLPLGRLPA